MPQIQRTLHTETLELQGTLMYRETTYQQVWHPTLNQGLQLSQVPAQSMQKVYLTKICGKHVAYQSMKSAVSNAHKSWVNCKICAKWYSRRHQPIASKTEHRVFRILQTRFAPDESFLDCRIICESTKVGSVDVWIPKHNLALTIDGSSHFVHKYNISKSAQRRIDDRFCVCALKHVNVLKVHYWDTSLVASLISDVVYRASHQSTHVLCYSPTFFNKKFVDDQHVADIIAQSIAVPATDDTATAL